MSRNEDRLKAISELASQMKIIHNEIERTESYLKDLKEQYNNISGVSLPELMAEIDMKRFVLKDGTSFNIRQVVSIKPIDIEMADDWLAQNGHDGMVKMQINIPRGATSELLDEVLAFIKKQGVTPEYKKTIHPQTLAKWCREMDEEGIVIPEELFQIFRANKTVID
jgi:inorganic pyrophosphatase/exopolyphosphatase